MAKTQCFVAKGPATKEEVAAKLAQGSVDMTDLLIILFNNWELVEQSLIEDEALRDVVITALRKIAERDDMTFENFQKVCETAQTLIREFYVKLQEQLGPIFDLVDSVVSIRFKRFLGDDLILTATSTNGKVMIDQEGGL